LVEREEWLKMEYGERCIERGLTEEKMAVLPPSEGPTKRIVSPD